MPFSNYTIDPQQIETLRSAFKKVCLELGLNCEAGDPMTEIIVAKIMAVAKTGETDPDRICSLVLADTSAPASTSERSGTINLALGGGRPSSGNPSIQTSATNRAR
jgi:hypothetical protein